jgi:hypothetical protein
MVSLRREDRKDKQRQVVTFASFALFIAESCNAGAANVKISRAHWLAAAFLGGTLGAGRAGAHHSISATYLLDKEMVLHGKIATFLLRNPHSFLLIDVPDEAGQTQQWSIEWAPAGQLGAQGIRGDTLKAGDEVEITIMPGKNPADHRGAVKILRRQSDGFEWGTKPGETLSNWMLPWEKRGAK